MHVTPRIHKDRKLDAELVSEVLNGRLIIHGRDSPYTKAVVAVAWPEVFADVRDLGRTHGSPGGKVDEQDGVAQLLAEADSLTVEAGELEVGCGSAEVNAQIVV